MNFETRNAMMNLPARLMRGLLAAFFLLAVACAHAQVLPKIAVGTVSTQNLVAAGVATANSAVEIDTTGAGLAAVHVTGTYTASGGLSAQITLDGTTWITLTGATTFTRMSTGATSATIASGVQDIFQVNVLGARKARISPVSGAVTGTAKLTIQAVPLSAVATGSGGGGGGAATVADGADANSGTTTDTAATAGGTGTMSAKLRLMTTQLGQLHTDIIAPNTNLTDTQTPVAPATATAVKGQLGALQYNSTPPTFTNGQQGSLQGDANGNLKVNIAAGASSGTVAQGSTTSGQSGMLAQGAVTTSAPSYTTAQTSPLSLDTAGNLRVSGSFAALDAGAISGTCSSSCLNTTLASWDTTGYASAEIQMTSVGTGGAFTFQCSSDGTTWYGCNGMSPSATGSGGVALSQVSALGLTCFPVWSKFQRLQTTSYTSGTVSATGYQRSKSGCGGFVANINSQATLTAQVQGANANGGAVANPVNIGVEARTTAPTATANTQITRMTGTVEGKPVVLPFAIPELTLQATSGATALTTNTSTQAFAAPAAGRNYVKACQFYNTHATVGTTFSVLDGNAGTALATVYLPAVTSTSPLVPSIVEFSPPLRGSATTRTDVQAGTTGANIYWSCQAYVAP